MADESNNDTIQRCPHDAENPYAQISRALIRDDSISPECRWLLIYMLSMKDGWKMKVVQIYNHVKKFIGKNRVYELVNEAIEAGYIYKDEKKLGNLKSGVTYFISESPKFKKCFRRSDFREAESRDPENREALSSNKDSFNKESFNEGKKEQEKEEEGVNPPTPPSASPKELYDLFLNKLKEKSPDFIVRSEKKWLKAFSMILNADKRDFEVTKQLIEWGSNHIWWRKACLSPLKLRLCYDEMLIQMQEEGKQTAEETIIKANREHVAEVQKRFPEKVRGLKIYQKYVSKEGTAKEVYFNLPQETFRAAFLGLFRGGYEG